MGFVHPQSPSTASRGVTSFWERLRELGYVEGQNLVIEARWAEGRYDRLPELMAEVIGRKVDVLVTYGTPAAVAAKNATSTIPIVGVAMGDPLRHRARGQPGTAWGQPDRAVDGLDRRYGGQVVGTAAGDGSAALYRCRDRKPGQPDVTRELAKELQVIAPTRGLKLRLIEVRESGALDRAFGQADQKAQGVLVLPDPVIAALREQLTALAAKHRLPTLYAWRDFVEGGRADGVRTGLCRPVPARRGVCRQDSQGRAARRPTHRAADPVRAGRQPEDRPRARAHVPPVDPGPRDEVIR